MCHPHMWRVFLGHAALAWCLWVRFARTQRRRAVGTSFLSVPSQEQTFMFCRQRFVPEKPPRAWRSAYACVQACLAPVVVCTRMLAPAVAATDLCGHVVPILQGNAYLFHPQTHKHTNITLIRRCERVNGTAVLVALRAKYSSKYLHRPALPTTRAVRFC